MAPLRSPYDFDDEGNATSTSTTEPSSGGFRSSVTSRFTTTDASETMGDEDSSVPGAWLKYLFSFQLLRISLNVRVENVVSNQNFDVFWYNLSILLCREGVRLRLKSLNDLYSVYWQSFPVLVLLVLDGVLPKPKYPDNPELGKIFSQHIGLSSCLVMSFILTFYISAY